MLKEVRADYLTFIAEEYCIFYAIRCLQAIQQNNIFRTCLAANL
jgi:hypothetical protein